MRYLRIYVLRVLVFCFLHKRYGQGDVVCPSGSRKAGQTCFKYHTSQKSWSNARTECQNTAGSDLLVIRNWELFDVIRRDINAYGYTFWIGASDRSYEGYFKWVDGTSCCGVFWNSGEPNQYESNDEDCVDFWNDGSETGFNDAPCSTTLNFVCELRGL